MRRNAGAHERTVRESWHTDGQTRDAAATSKEQKLDDITDSATSMKGSADAFDLTGALHTVANASSNQDAFGPLRGVLISLDSLIQVHPFLAVVVIPFRLVLTLEMSRRDNDRRILILLTQMTDMMDDLCALPHEPLEIGPLLRAQLNVVLLNIEDKIKECGNTVDVYYKSKLIVRILKSLSWQTKLEDLAQSFGDLKRRLAVKLLLIINKTVSTTKLMTSASNSKLDDVLRMLRRQTELETDLLSFVEAPGTITKAMKDDESMRRLIRTFETIDADGQKMKPPNRSNSVTSRHDTNLMSGNGSRAVTRYDGTAPRAPSAWLPSRSDHPRPYTTSAPKRHVPLPQSPYPPPSTPIYRAPSLHPIHGPAYPDDNTAHRHRRQSGPRSDVPLNDYRGRLQRKMSMPELRGPEQQRASAFPASATYVFQSPARGSIRTSAATRRPFEDIFEADGSVKPIVVEQYRNEIHHALSTELKSMLEQNRDVWGFKVEQLTADVTRHFDAGTRKVLAAIDGGPHERLTDADLRAVWATERFRGSVKSHRFLQAVQDFMLEEPQMLRARTASEEWAVHFLSVPYRFPLLQEIDWDCSEFISVAEVNQFTDRKPSNVSLLFWLAYSAVAWAYEANECRKRIRRSWARLEHLLSPPRTIPYALFDFCLSIGPEIMSLLNALRIPARKISEPYAHPRMVEFMSTRFLGRLADLEAKLDQMNWEIDSLATLRVVAGERPIETYLLPLLSILISRFVERVESSPTSFSYREIFATKDTFGVVMGAVDERVIYMMDCFRPSSPQELALSFKLFSRWQPKETSESHLLEFVPTEGDVEEPVEPRAARVTFNPAVRGLLADEESIDGRRQPTPFVAQTSASGSWLSREDAYTPEISETQNDRDARGVFAPSELGSDNYSETVYRFAQISRPDGDTWTPDLQNEISTRSPMPPHDGRSMMMPQPFVPSPLPMDRPLVSPTHSPRDTAVPFGAPPTPVSFTGQLQHSVAPRPISEQWQGFSPRPQPWMVDNGTIEHRRPRGYEERVPSQWRYDDESPRGEYKQLQSALQVPSVTSPSVSTSIPSTMTLVDQIGPITPSVKSRTPLIGSGDGGWPMSASVAPRTIPLPSLREEPTLEFVPIILEDEKEPTISPNVSEKLRAAGGMVVVGASVLAGWLLSG